MHAIQRRLLALGEEIRGAHVGRQHAFLDQLVRVVARRGHDARDLAVLVELDARARRVSKSMAPRLSRAAASASIQRVEVRQMRQQRHGLRRVAPWPVADSQSHTCVYVSRACECITAG